ncbi:MAG: clostripain-related cysteine peptidase [Promethearchaeota archaeon]
MKKISLALTQAVLFTILLISLFGSILLIPIVQNLNESRQNTKVIANWTVMVYLDADNNLDSYGVDDINEMEDGYDDDRLNDVHVITLIDRAYSGATTYKITENHDYSYIDSTVLTTGFPSEPDMGEKATLKAFIKFCINNYPAQSYVLILWNHGGGVFGICWDDTDDENRLSLDEVDEAINEALSETGTSKLDILVMDACLMHMLEADYEFTGAVDYVVASEETIPGDGFPYDAIIDSICSDYTQTAYNYAVDLVEDYYTSYSGYAVTLSAVDVRSPQFDSLIQAFNDFCDVTINSAPRDILTTARAATQHFYYEEFVDLRDFCIELENSLSGYPNIQAAAQELKNNISNVVINNKQSGYPGAYGIAIYFPESETSVGYETYIDLAEDTDWDAFLNYFWNGPTFSLSLTDYSITDDGIAEQSETCNLSIEITNTGSEPMTSVNGTLISLDGNITVDTPLQDYGTLNDDDEVSRNFQITVDGAAPTGLIVEFSFIINASFSQNYVRTYTVSIAINVSIFKGGSSFDTAVSIDGLFSSPTALFYSMLPGLDPRDYSTWFKVNMNNISEYIICCILEASNNTDFDLYVYTPSGSLLTVAGAYWYPDYCSSFLPNTGNYRIKVYPYNGMGVFRLNVTRSSTPGPEDGLSIGTAISLNINTTYPVEGTLPTPTKSGGIFYRVYVTKGWTIKAILDSDTPSHDFDVYIFGPDLNYLAGSTASSYPQSCQAGARKEGYHYIYIVPKTGSGDFMLTLEFKEPFTLSTPMIIIIVVIVVAAVIVGIYLFFKMA